MQTVRWLLCALLLYACSRSEGETDRNKAAQPMDDLTVTRDVPYETGNRHRLDIYAPRGMGAPRPVMIYFYGSAWTGGMKAGDSWVGAALARHGYVVVVPDYRLYPEVRWPAFLEDGAAAIKWTHDHITDYGGDPTALVLIGHSAGAFNVLSLAVDRQWLMQAGLDAGRDVKAAIALSSPYMGLPLGSDEAAIFDVRYGYREPLDRVDGHSPPLLFLVGDGDNIIDPHENDPLIGKVRAKGGVADIIHYPGLGHGDTKEALADSRIAPIADDIARFLAAHDVRPPPDRERRR